MEQREIKFRMWNNVNGNMELSRMFYDTENVIECLRQQINFNSKQKIGYNHIGDGNSFMQYTGLKDKNGKEIYEGDILKNSQIDAICEVVFGQYSTMKDGRGIEEVSPKFCVLWHDKSGYSSIKSDKVEIIGNIHQDKHLLT